MFVLTDEVRTARKFYDCDACEMWRSYGPPDKELTADERLVLDGVRADKCKIRPGAGLWKHWVGTTRPARKGLTASPPPQESA